MEKKKTRGFGIDKSRDKELQRLIADYAGKFEQKTYEDDQTGLSINYNLFLPEHYQNAEKYPLVLFIADASTVGREVEVPLIQGYGALVWVTEEFQKEFPCIVAVPQYPEVILDDHGAYTKTEYVEMTKRLLDDIVHCYAVKESQIYGTGQSMGCMATMVLAAKYPELFTACMLVDGQWDEKELASLSSGTFLYFAAEGDEKAFKGMQALLSIVKEEAAAIGQIQLNAKWEREEIETAMDGLLEKGKRLNFITWEKGSVLPDPLPERPFEHMYSFDPAYKIRAAQRWLFCQKKEE